MAPLPFLPAQTKSQTRLSSDSKKKNGNKKTSTQPPQTQTLKQTQKLKQKTVSSSSSSSWSQIKNLLSCKQIEGPRVHDPSKITLSSCGSSLCKFSDVIYGNARVIHRSDHSPESSNLGQDGGLLIRKPATRGSSSTVRSNGCGAYTSSSKAMHFRKLSGCYECHMIVDPSRYPISPRIFACPQCGEVFPKLETLEIHQAVRHADTKTVTKSHIPAANAPARIKMPNEQEKEDDTREPKTRLKRGRPIGSKDKNLRKQKKAEIYDAPKIAENILEEINDKDSDESEHHDSKDNHEISINYIHNKKIWKRNENNDIGDVMK